MIIEGPVGRRARRADVIIGRVHVTITGPIGRHARRAEMGGGPVDVLLTHRSRLCRIA